MMTEKENKKDIKFDSLGLCKQILEAIAEKGYETPSPIQAQAIPPILERKDIMAAAQTGTGKTAGFTLPLLEILSKGNRPQPKQVRALILTPTRELAAQIDESVSDYGKNLSMKSAVIFGGVSIGPQKSKLLKGLDILVATPGRLLDLYGQKAVKFDQLEILVLDEADRMLDMGFIHDIRKIISKLPSQRQNLMFSATFSDEIRKLAKGMIRNPVEVSVTPRNTTVEAIEQWIHPVDKNQKSSVLIKMILENDWEQILVFSRTKHGANRLTQQLEKQKIKSVAIHGNKSQNARTKALADFKAGKVQILVATDIAARGIDIDQLPQVVNFDLPDVPEDYVHRIGRTGRAGSTGRAISLVCADEFKQLSAIERLIKQILDRKLVEGFMPIHHLPQSRLDAKPSGNRSNKGRGKSGHRDGQRGPRSKSHNSRNYKGRNPRPSNNKASAT